MPPRRDDDRLVNAVMHDSEASLELLREMSVTIGQLHEQHLHLQNLVRYHMGALVGIVILLIMGLFALVRIKLQYPSIPMGP